MSEQSGFSQHITINGKTIGPGHRPYVLAEMACAHNGEFDQAVDIIEAAISAGADAVQLQFFVPEETVTPEHEAYDIVKGIAFSEQQWAALVNKARESSIDVWACTYDLPSVELAVRLGADGIKLNSADLSNPEVVVAVAKSGIPFTLGTGASTMEEITSGLELIAQCSAGESQVILMHGVQNFPTVTEDLNIARLSLLRDVFPGLPLAYGDHTSGDDALAGVIDLVAVGQGADFIEKHITLSRAEKGIDYQAALEPDEYKQFVKTIAQAYAALGSREVRAFNESDLKYRKFQKKSIVAARNLRKGDCIDRQAVQFLRNEEPGIAPNCFEELVGNVCSRDIAHYENILPQDVEAQP